MVRSERPGLTRCCDRHMFFALAQSPEEVCRGARVRVVFRRHQLVSIHNHNICAAYTPTVSGGVGTSGEGVVAYLLFARLPELAW
eukprot:3129772-Lingulodinium_polyedra.AAC.1